MESEITAKRLGPILFKSTGDRHRYYCKLITGEVVCFLYSHYDGGDWIRLTVKEVEPPLKDADGCLKTDRGLTVRLDHIVWVLDYEKS